MLRSLFMLGIYVGFLGLSVGAPFVATLGYVWVDTFQPQHVAYVIMDRFPVAMVMGAAAIGLYFLADRRAPPRPNGITYMQVALAVWVTVTLLWAVDPVNAWAKWDWAFKTLVFAAFIPYVIRSQVQIEAFIQVYMLALAANIIPFGLKILIAGGGYGRNLGLTGGNSGLAEGATLASVACMAIPLLLYLRKHARLIPSIPWFREIYLGMAALAVLTSIGTYQRSGLVGLLVVGAATAAYSKHKIFISAVCVVVGIGIAYMTTDAWVDRISTITTYKSDTSAMTRLLVWRWTLDYAISHPLGGGFEMYRINAIYHPPSSANPTGIVEYGRAFHSIYFEVLGEHGWIGLSLFLGLFGLSLLRLRRAAKLSRDVEGLEWCVDLARALQASLLVMAACGAFIGIAFQPMIHYLFALAVVLPEYVRRCVAQPDMPQAASSWRSRATALPDPSDAGRGKRWAPAAVGPSPRSPGVPGIGDRIR
jgi:probable O-glycosylation ligase (exosortase A-associated)